MQNISQKNLPGLHLLVGQVSWPNDLQFNTHIQKCTLPCAHDVATHHNTQDVATFEVEGMVWNTENGR